MDRTEILERRRQALLADLFFTGTNAITEKGQLVNLDMVGNRVAGLTYGPRHVILTVGRNKLVHDLAAAMEWIRTYAAPLNVLRHPGFRTPCALTGYFQDCVSPDRLCISWTITENSVPSGRVRVILINEDLGLGPRRTAGADDRRELA
ncbi:MAG: lactate utilization protein, partial [Desulfobulbus sp.]|nr:lactate utilization protein [Desulfobulbus sp.]